MKLTSLTKNTIILGIGQLIPKIISVITLPLLTKAFSTSDYGIYDLVLSFSSLFLPIMTLMIQQAVFRFLIEDSSEKNRKICVSNALFVIFFISLVVLFFAVLITKYTKNNIEIVLVAFLIYFLESIYDLLGQISRGIGKNTWYSIAIIFYSISNMIFLLIAIKTNILNIQIALLIIGIAYLIASIYLSMKLNIKEYIHIKDISIINIKKLLLYSIPIVPSSISLWITNLSDRFIITYFIGTSLNGIYAAACKLPNMYANFYNVFNLAWTEHAARNINKPKIEEYYSSLLKKISSMMIGILLLLLTFSKLLFKLLIDSKFQEGYAQLPILYVGILFSCFVSFYGGLYVALKKSKQVGMSSIIGAILNFLINIIFIKKIGLYAASVSTLISFFIILMYRVIDINKYIKLKYKFKDILIYIITIIISICLFYMNNTIAFGLNIIISTIFNIIFNFKEINSLLKNKDLD